MRRTVQDVMIRDVVVALPPTTFKELVRLLNHHRITAVPVVDDHRVVVGVVSETDLALKEVAPLRDGHVPIFESARHRDERAKAAGMTAAELMTAPAVTASPDEPIGVAARRMHDRQVKRLPVVDRAGVLVGIVTRADVLKVFLRPDEEIRSDLVDDVVGDLLGLSAPDLSVVVAGGVVELGGLLPRRSQALAMARLAAAIDGVVAVRSRLTWETDDSVAPWLPTEPLPTL